MFIMRLANVSCCFLFSATSVSAQFTYLGRPSIGNSYANPLIKLRQDTMFVPSENGLFKKNLISVDTFWIAAGFQGKRINDYILIGLDTILAAVDSTEGNTVFLSTDNGYTNSNRTNGFGGTGPDFLPCSRLDFRKENHHEITGMSGSCIARSTDLGNNWIPVHLDWGYLTYQSQVLRYHPLNSNYIYSGGELPVLDSYLDYSLDDGVSWYTSASTINNAVNGIAFHPADTNILFLGREGRITRSVDKGVTWNDVYLTPNYEYVYAIVFDQTNPAILYAGGALNGTNDTIRIFKSMDTGVTWSEWISAYLPEANGIRHMIMADNALYILSFTGRVYKFNDVSLSVKEASLNSEVTIYPNPVRDYLNVSVPGDHHGPIRYEILDPSGKHINKGVTLNRKVNCAKLPGGVYIIHIELKEGRGSFVRFVKE